MPPGSLPHVGLRRQPLGLFQYPAKPVGWSRSHRQRSGDCWPPTAESCTDIAGQPLPGMPPSAPTTSVAVDPELGFEIQKFILFYSYVFLPASQKTTGSTCFESSRWRRRRSSAHPVGDGRLERPQTGFQYFAKRFGDEPMMGKTYDKGIAAKMLQWRTRSRRARMRRRSSGSVRSADGPLRLQGDPDRTAGGPRDPLIRADDSHHVRCDENSCACSSQLPRAHRLRA